MSYICCVCGQQIQEPALYACDGRHFHKACLQCQKCGRQPQDDRLYAFDGLLVCRHDYQSLRSACRVCQQRIAPNEYRIRGQNNARDFSIHINCMSCSACRASLEKGDKYTLDPSNRLLCHKCQTLGGAPARRGRKRAQNT